MNGNNIIDVTEEVTKLAKLIHKQYVDNTYMLVNMEHSLKGNATLKNHARGPLIIFKNGTIHGRNFNRLIELYDHTLIKLLGFDILVLIDTVMTKYHIDTKCKKYICNEIYNCINHNNISFKPKLRKKDTFDVLIEYFNLYGAKVNTICNLEKSTYTSEDVFLATGYDDMEWSLNTVEYKMIMIPALPFNSEAVRESKYPMLDPVILDENMNIVYNSKLNNSIAYLSKKYKLPLYIRCLVPITAINDNSIVNNYLQLEEITQVGPVKSHIFSVTSDMLELSQKTFCKRNFSERNDYMLLKPYWVLNSNSFKHIKG